jgi:two-component system, cell cycle sensor histidine kinase and response regulator CckA
MTSIDGSGQVPGWKAYGCAIVATAATVGVRLALDGPLAGQPTLVLFTIPILLSGYVGGLRGGLLATALSWFAAGYFLPPFQSLHVTSMGDRWQQFFVVLAGVLISVSNEALHRARRRAGVAIGPPRAAAEAGRRSEQRLRDLIDGLGPSIFVGLLTPDGILIETNRPALAAAGLAPEDVLGKPFAETYWWTHSPDVQAQLREAIARGARGEPSRYDVQVRVAENHLIDVDFSLQVMRDEAGRVAFLVPSASVITERKNVEAELRRADQELRRLVERLEVKRARLVAAQAVARVGSWETDLATLAVAWSAETYRIFGVDPDAFEPTHQRFLDFVHPDDRRAVDEAFARSRGRPGTHTVRHRLLLAEGRIKFVEERWESISDDQDRPVRAVGTCQDISERTEAAAALEQLLERTDRRERMLSATLASIRDFAFAYDRHGRILFANQPLLDVWGKTLEEVVGRNLHDLLDPVALADRLQRQIEEVFETKRTVTDETPYTSPAGVAGYYEYILSPAFGAAGTVDFVVGTSRDVTERKRAEAGLRTSLDELQTLAEAMPQIVYVTRPDGWTIWLNQQWLGYTGLTLEESVGQGWIQAFHPEDAQRAWIAWQEATATTSTISMECRLRRADGVFRWWLIRCVPQRDAAGVVMRWLGTATDIHDLKMAKTAVSASEERFATVFQSNLIALGITEMPSGRFLDVNSRAGEFFGYTRDEMIGHTALELGLWSDPAEHERRIAALAAGTPTSTGEASFRRKSGEIRHALVSMEAMTLSGVPEPLVVWGIVDITERKRLEGQLLQAQKMDAVGRLAGGVAHDFNNSLGVILGYTELLMRRAKEPEKGKLEQILKATRSASGLTRQLLAFSRKQVVDPKVLDLNALVSDLQKMLGRLIGENIDLAIVAGADLGQVKADPGQIEQVVMNLCVNARDAMPQGGLLRVETANAGRAAVLGGEPQMAPGRYVTLAVSDTGCGIAAETLAQIFEPFFTTKEEGKGTGLGLAMVYGIVKQAGGSVWAESELGKGTTFRIYLPRIDEPAEHLPAEETATTERGWETILLVEDEAALRAIAREILEDHGFHVIEAARASEAIEIAQRHPEPIHLLLTDVIMPGMNGRVLAETLLAARPATRVVYMSGYTDDIVAHSGVLNSGTFLLEKPFTALALLARVRAALGGPRPMEAATSV